MTLPEYEAARLLWGISLTAASDQGRRPTALNPHSIMDTAMLAAGLREVDRDHPDLPAATATIGAVIR